MIMCVCLCTHISYIYIICVCDTDMYIHQLWVKGLASSFMDLK